MSKKNKEVEKLKETLPTEAEKNEIEMLTAPAEGSDSASTDKELKEGQTKNLSMNAESKGFGSDKHIEDIKKRQQEGGEVSFDEEQLLSQQV